MTAERRHLPGLDGLRGIAVVVVVLHHATAYLVPSLWGTLPGGFLGVDLFMVLSGYLITTILASDVTRERWMARFYQRRALRLFPALLGLLAVLCLLRASGLEGAGDFPRSVGAALLYVFNWVTLPDRVLAFDYMGHLWSLSVEEQFYILWPILFAAAGRRALALAAAGVVATALWRAHLFDGDWMAVYTRTDTRTDALLIGCCVALSPRLRQVLARYASAGLVVFLGFVLLVDRESAFLFNGGFTLVAVACAAMVSGVVENRWAPGLTERWALMRLGVVSYGLYLWHFPVMMFVKLELGWTGLSALVVGLAGSALATWASWRFIEAPALRWKDRVTAKNPVLTAAGQAAS